jgi:hypothetical protein
MNNIFYGIAFITNPRNKLFADNAYWCGCQITTATSARSPVIQYLLLDESSLKSVTYPTISY